MAIINNAPETKEKKKLWSQKWRECRQTMSRVNLLKELQAHSKADYRNFLRMDEATYKELMEKITPHLPQRRNTRMRECISIHERLSTTLRFLAAGTTFANLQFDTFISKAGISKVVIETCNAIIVALNNYVNLPQNENEWRRIAMEFESLWDFPHCMAAIDGKHINIKRPVDSGSYFLNYKGTYSIVLMALVDAQCNFIMVDVGANGRQSDGGVFANTKMAQLLGKGGLHIPPPQKIGNFPKKLPYVFVADNAFPLDKNLLKPYNRQAMNSAEETLNYRLSRARQVVERAFGIISSRFRLLHSTIGLSPEKTGRCVLAICYLHNFLQSKNKNYINRQELNNTNQLTSIRTKQNDSTPKNQGKNVRDFVDIWHGVRSSIIHYF